LTFGRKSQDVVGIDTTGMVGNYTKVSLSLLDKQVLNKDWYALFNMRAQLGSRNLDAYEAMSVGGVTGVRAFSASEGSLNNALFLSTELRRLVRLPDGSQIAPGVFIDYITGRVVHSPYAGWQTSLGYADPNLSNHRWLAAWGLGVDWVSPKGMFNASMTIAWKLPGSPDSVVSPGSARARVLLSAGLKF
jgi:hemolysin activation/secretion protein